MCLPPEAVPPSVPGLTGAERPPSADATITAEDGARVLVSYSMPATIVGPGIVILPDVRGLFDFYRLLAREFAAAGYPAIVVDYFGRTAPGDERPNDFDFLPHVKQTSVDDVQRDIRSAATLLRTITSVEALVTVGFCFGGTQSYFATRDARLGLSGAVSFYGGLDETRLGVFPRPSAEASTMRGPLLAIFGGADASITKELREQFDEALTGAEVDHEFVVYDDAPHSFFDRSHGSFEDECADAWRRVLAFLRELA